MNPEWWASPATGLRPTSSPRSETGRYHRRNTTDQFNTTPGPSQPPTFCGTGNEYQPKCGDALRLGAKTGWLNPFVDKLCDPFNTCHPERFRDEHS